MRLFENFTETEKQLFLKFPAYISMLVANADAKMNEVKRKEVIRLRHITTYPFSPGLSLFYKEAERVFQKNINELENQLPKDKTIREQIINKELEKIRTLLTKLDKQHLRHMKKDMQSYKEHVSKSHTSFFLKQL